MIDVNYYPIPEARRSNMRYRPLDSAFALSRCVVPPQHQLRLLKEALEFADESMEMVSYHALLCVVGN